MADSLSKEKRSWNMSRIKSKNTSIENIVCKYLFSHGFRYRKNVAKLPGKPDIVLSKYKTVIFIHGCFWHRHENCKYSTIPKSRTDFWEAKFSRNVEKDKINEEKLKNDGWNVIVLWECEIEHKFQETMKRLENSITNKAEYK